MKLKVTTWNRDDGSGGGYKIKSEKHSYSLMYDCESPEDAIYGRNLEDESGLLDLIQEAYEAGKYGDTIEIETVVEE